jgi:PAS domain S-box-containing protein/putative nucleotidyltransferase with HDIG domain
MRETELQHKESDTLPRSGEIYKALVAYSQDAILGVNRKGIIVFWNNGAERIFGYSAEEILGQPITNLVSEKHRQGHTPVLRALLSGNSGEARALAGEALRKDGSTFPIELSFSNEQQSGKSVALAIVKNITKRKQMQNSLKESAERYCNLFSACLETVFSAHMQDNTETTNEALGKLCGYCLQELARMTTEAALPEEARDYLSEQVDTILSIDEGASSIVHNVLSKNGKRILTERYLDSLEIEDKPSEFQVFSSEVAEHDTEEGQLKSSFANLAKVISHVIEFCDPYTANHQERVAELACLVARNMGLADDVVERLYFNGLLHDIGKISIPRSILTKPGELADEEWALIRAHTKQGYHILKDANLPWPVADVALQHHERLDGSGYPNGVAGDELNLEVSILAVCDVVEAMSSHRPYRPARTTEDILKELTDGRGTRYDASVVDVVLPKVESGEFRSMWTCGN